MRILALTSLPKVLKKTRLHLGFLELLKDYCEDLILLTRDELFDTKQIVQGRFIPKLKSVRKLVRKYNPDLVLVYSSWHFPDGYFADIPSPKIMVETDTCYKKNNLNYYTDNGFLGVLHRGAEEFPSSFKMQTAWLPFSADPSVFHPGKKTFSKRKAVIGFVGARKAKVYSLRRRALSTLRSVPHLLQDKGKIIDAYPQFLRNVRGMLTSTEMFSSPHTPRGKFFEALASKTVVLTSPFVGERELFKGYSCPYVRYSLDCKDLLSKAQHIIEDYSYAAAIAENGYNAFLSKHTHNIRIAELWDNLVNIYEGKKLQKRWGQ